MITKKRFFTLEIDERLHERELMRVIVPENDMELDILFDWMHKELREDLGNLDDEDLSTLGHFYRTCLQIKYMDDGRFYFDPKETNTPSSETIFFYIHPFILIPENKKKSDNSNVPFQFELIWEHQGVSHSLYDLSIIENLMTSM